MNITFDITEKGLKALELMIRIINLKKLKDEYKQHITESTIEINVKNEELTAMMNDALHVYVNEYMHIKNLLADEQKKAQRLSTELNNKLEIINKLKEHKHKGKIAEVLYNLDLMGTCSTDHWRITRVPGGWIFTDIISGQNVFTGFSDEYEEE